MSMITFRCLVQYVTVIITVSSINYQSLYNSNIVQKTYLIAWEQIMLRELQRDLKMIGVNAIER